MTTKWKDWNNDICLNHIHKLMDMIDGLYESEINFTISSFWDEGFTAKIGDTMNGFDEQKTFDTFWEAVDWVAHRAVELYPESSYSCKFKAGAYYA